MPEYASCGKIRFEIYPGDPGLITEKFYPAQLDKDVYYPEERTYRRLLYRYFHPKSFRRVPIQAVSPTGQPQIVGALIACPIDKWDERAAKCTVGTMSIQVYHGYWKLAELGTMCRTGELLRKRRSSIRRIEETIERIDARKYRAVAGLGQDYPEVFVRPAIYGSGWEIFIDNFLVGSASTREAALALGYKTLWHWQRERYAKEESA